MSFEKFHLFFFLACCHIPKSESAFDFRNWDKRDPDLIGVSKGANFLGASKKGTILKGAIKRLNDKNAPPKKGPI